MLGRGCHNKSVRRDAEHSRQDAGAPLTVSHFFHESRSATVRLNTGFEPG
jgi:hypothetical protein